MSVLKPLSLFPLGVVLREDTSEVLVVQDKYKVSNLDRGLGPTVKPLINDTLKRTNLPTKDKPKVLLYTLYRKSPLKKDNLSTKDKMAGPEGERFHCTGPEKVNEVSQISACSVLQWNFPNKGILPFMRNIKKKRPHRFF